MIARHPLGCLIVSLFLAMHASSIHASEQERPGVPTHVSMQAVFAPWDDVEGTIKACIDQAKKQILVQAYLLTNKKITDALLSARRRGIDVRILADARKHAETPSSRLAVLAASGIDVRLETDYENAHNKVIIVDAASPHPIVITGSFNFTWTAQHRNAENVLIVRGNSSLTTQYEMNWLRHQQSAVPFTK